MYIYIYIFSLFTELRLPIALSGKMRGISCVRKRRYSLKTRKSRPVSSNYRNDFRDLNLARFVIPSCNRVLKPWRHVTMVLKNSVPNKGPKRDRRHAKCRPSLSRRSFLSSEKSRSQLRRVKTTTNQAMWSHLIIVRVFYEEKCTQACETKSTKSRWVEMVPEYSLQMRLVI